MPPCQNFTIQGANKYMINFNNKSKTEIELIIESNKTSAGGWTKDTLKSWGVSWPPPKGWKKFLIEKGLNDELS